MSYKWVKRIARGMLPCFVFFVFSFSFAPNAYAASFNGDISYGFQIKNLSGSVDTYYLTNASLPVTNGDATTTQYWMNSQFGMGARLNTYPAQEFNSTTKVYASFYPVSKEISDGGVASLKEAEDFYSAPWTVSYINTMGQTGYVEGGLSSFDFGSSSASLTGKVYAIEAVYSATESLPIRALNIKQSPASGFVASSSATNFKPAFIYPSIRIITTSYTAEMEGLDNIANQIVAQNEVLLAMKGELVAILQDIYQMTGDMYQAQLLLNSYVSQLLPYLQNINQNTANIYSLLVSQLRALETAIETAATSIEAAIAAQTAAMIAYLDSVLNTGNEVPDDTYNQTQDAENILDQLDQLEKPNVDTIVPIIDDYSNGDVSGVLNAIWGSNLIMTMMTVSVSLAFGAYVLFGKRS